MSKIISIKRISAIFLAIVLVVGTIALSYQSSFMTSAQAQPYYDIIENRYDSYGPPEYPPEYPDNNDYYNSYESKYPENNYQHSYGNDNYGPEYLSYSKDNYKSKESTIINKINCINPNNINVNGDFNGNITTFAASSGQAAAAEGNLGDSSSEGYGEGYEEYSKQGKGILCIITNNNNNTNGIVGAGGGGTGGGGGNQTGIINNHNNNTNVIVGADGDGTGDGGSIQTGSLIVKKEIFGCTEIFDGFEMVCLDLENDSSDWLSCDNIIISTTIFCQALPANIFDIEVLDGQNTQIQQFQGSQQGTTIQNLEPGIYTVNEIRHESGNNQFVVDPSSNQACLNKGFSGGGALSYSNEVIRYPEICFEYKDEQGNDCSTLILAAGEEKTCIVKNYIALSLAEPNGFTAAGSSSITTQGTADSSELTALDKIEKLKQQWLELLP